MALVLEKEIGFESADEEIKKGLEKLFGKRFQNLGELEKAMYQKSDSGTQLLPKNVYVSIRDLPHTISRLPIYYFEGHGVGGLSKVAEVVAVP